MTEDDWRRLAEAIRDRRDELGLTQQEVTARGGPSTATMRLLEGALQEGYRSRTFTQLDDALEWTRGSARAVLRGGQATARVSLVKEPPVGAGVQDPGFVTAPGERAERGMGDRDVVAAIDDMRRAVEQLVRTNQELTEEIRRGRS